MPSVVVHAPELAGTAGLFLFLRAASNGALLNTGGDALTESATGVFTATVAETVSAIQHARVHSSSTEDATTSLRDGWLDTGGTVVQDDYPVGTNLATIELWVKRNAVILTGTISTAGTNTEVFTVSALGITATCTVDASGNRSAVVWS